MKSDTRKLVVTSVLFLLMIDYGQGYRRPVPKPPTSCITQDDCEELGWTSPLPECRGWECQCSPGKCAFYTSSNVGYSYYCGTCGRLGSWCNETLECDIQPCGDDNFCHCDQGSVIREICMVYEPVPTSVSSLVLIFILVLLIVIHRLIDARKTIKKCCLRRSRDSEADETSVVGYNPESLNKSAAYTISNSQFMATSEDPDFDWALELSRQLTRQEDWIPLEESTWSSLSSTVQSSRGILPQRLRGERGGSRTSTDLGAPRIYCVSVSGSGSSIRSRSSSNSQNSQMSSVSFSHPRQPSRPVPECSSSSDSSSSSSLTSPTAPASSLVSHPEESRNVSTGESEDSAFADSHGVSTPSGATTLHVGEASDISVQGGHFSSSDGGPSSSVTDVPDDADSDISVDGDLESPQTSPQEESDFTGCRL